jgi:hypothetical protein
LVAAPTSSSSSQWETKSELLGRARRPAADELFVAATAVIESASRERRHIGQSAELAAIWSSRLSEWICEKLAANEFNEPASVEALRMLVEHDLQAARPLLRRTLADATNEQSSRARAGALLLAHDATDSWLLVYEAMRKSPTLGEQIAFAYIDRLGYHEHTPGLSEAAVAELYVWLVMHFPFEEDPQFDGVHAVGPREQLGMWRDGLLRELQGRGTQDSVAAIGAIEAALPDHTWLRAVRRDAERRTRASTWTPVEPDQLLGLVAQSTRRLVTADAQLLDVVLDALTEIQDRLTGETPESHLLWDTRSGRPKPEDDISDYLLNRLRDLLETRGIVVNREVQVRRVGTGIGERTDLRIDAVAAEGAGEPRVLTLVIEVKGAWHRELLDAIRDQLGHRYMVDLSIARGIYLVVWPDLESWSGDDRDRRVVAERPKRRTHDELNRRASELEAEGLHVVVVPLDMTFGRPSSLAPEAG